MNNITKIFIAFSLAIALWVVNVTAYALPIAVGYNHPPGEERMQREEMQAVIEKAAKAWETGETMEFVQSFAPHGKLIVPGREWVGQTEIESAFQQFMKESKNVKISISRMMAEDNVAVVEWHWESTQEGGESEVTDNAIVVDFQDGKITRWREYMDRESFNP